MIRRAYGIDGGRPPPIHYSHYLYYLYYLHYFSLTTITPDPTLITQASFLYMFPLIPYYQSFLLTHF